MQQRIPEVLELKSSLCQKGTYDPLARNDITSIGIYTRAVQIGMRERVITQDKAAVKLHREHVVEDRVPFSGADGTFCHEAGRGSSVRCECDRLRRRNCGTRNGD